MCGKCIEVCPLGIDSLNIKIAQRENISYRMKSDFGYLGSQQVNETTRQQGNESTRQRDNETTSSDSQVFRFSNSKTVYFAGCMSHLTPRITRSMVKIFKEANENYEFLDMNGSICCGRPMMLTGKKKEAQALIDKNTELIKNSGAKRLVLSCG